MKRPRRGRSPAHVPKKWAPDLRQGHAPLKGPVVDILVESKRWNARRGIKPLLRRAVAEAAAALSTSDAELAIVLTHDSAIRRLNREWRGKDEPTNVLAFPARPAAGGRQGPQPHPLMGDIVIAYQTLAREAAAEGKPFGHHLAHLAVHGFLHLSGHDHLTDRQAAAMEGLEIAILARLGIPNPYVARANVAPGRHD
jgi:probable rRNA maturation factor